MMSAPPSWVYAHPHPAVAADIMVLGYDLEVGRLGVLLIERGEEPFKGAWALPGGFLRPDETIEQCAQRELAEETGVDATVELIGTFSAPGRDPRERVVSIAWFACVDHTACRPRAGSDAAGTDWHLIADLPDMAFDHAEIIKAGMERVRTLAKTSPIAGRLLPRVFSLSDLQRVQEALLGCALDKRNFRREVAEAGWLELAGVQRLQKGRPSQVWRLAGTALLGT